MRPGRYRLRRLPASEPRTPRNSAPVIRFEAVRVAVLAKDSSSPSRRPPRGPVLPKMTPPRPPSPGLARVDPGAQLLERRLAIHLHLVHAGDDGLAHERLSLVRRDRADPGCRCEHPRPLRDARDALLVQQGDERLAHSQLEDRRRDVDLRVGAHRLGGGPHRFLVAWRVGAQGVLDPVAELAQHLVGDVDRVLRDEVDAHALRANEAHDQLHLLEEGRRRIGKQQVGFVKEEDELRLLAVADFREVLEQLGQHPEEEAGVEARVVHQRVGDQDVHHATTVRRLHQVIDVEHRLAEELRAPLVLELQEAALDRTDAGGGDIAVPGAHLGGVVADELQHRPEVCQVEQEQAVVVRDPERHREHPFLRFVQVEQAREEQGSHVGDRGPDRMPLLAEHVPEGHGTAGPLGRRKAELLQSRRQFFCRRAGHGDAAQVALGVGEEDRHADAREVLGEDLEGNGLPGTGGAGDASVPVGESGEERQVHRTRSRDDEGIGHGQRWPVHHDWATAARMRQPVWACGTRHASDAWRPRSTSSTTRIN